MPYTGWQPKEECAECKSRSVLAECDVCGKKLCLPCANIETFAKEGEKPRVECDSCLVKREQLEDHKEVDGGSGI